MRPFPWGSVPAFRAEALQDFQEKMNTKRGTTRRSLTAARWRAGSNVVLLPVADVAECGYSAPAARRPLGLGSISRVGCRPLHSSHQIP
ncbi:unnamed protein product [Lota lota]